MKTYEYPQVHPPTSVQPSQTPSERRFSWIDTSADEENRVWANSTPQREVRINTSPPATTDLPRHEAQSMEPHAYAHGAYPPQGGDAGVVQQQYGQDPRQYTVFPTQSPPAQGPTLPAQTQPVYRQVPPPSQHQIVGANAEPAGLQYETTKPIGPDVNPLTPTSPKFSKPASTNMAIVPPPIDPTQFSIGAFTPNAQVNRGGSWQHNICSCAEPSTCLIALFCPCVVYGKTQYRLGLRADRKDPTNMLGYTAVNGSCIAFGILCGINCILAAIQHMRVRKSYSMNTEAGNVPGDCLKGICCCCCIVAQDEKEVKFREEQARKPAGSANRQEGYITPTAMTFSAPPR